MLEFEIQNKELKGQTVGFPVGGERVQPTAGYSHGTESKPSAEIVLKMTI